MGHVLLDGVCHTDGRLLDSIRCFHASHCAGARRGADACAQLGGCDDPVVCAAVDDRVVFDMSSEHPPTCAGLWPPTDDATRHLSAPTPVPAPTPAPASPGAPGAPLPLRIEWDTLARRKVQLAADLLLGGPPVLTHSPDAAAAFAPHAGTFAQTVRLSDAVGRMPALTSYEDVCCLGLSAATAFPEVVTAEFVAREYARQAQWPERPTCFNAQCGEWRR